MFWDELKPDDQEAISSAGTRRQYPVGAHLFLNGERSTHVVVILDGLVKLTRTSIDGHEVIIELRGAGYVLGEMGVVDDDPRSATATVVEAVDSIVISANEFRQLVEDRAGLASALLTQVTEKLRQATERRLEASVGDAQARLCGRLVELAAGMEPGPDGVIEVKSPITQQELADWIGVSRDAVVLALRRIRELGWIETGRRTIRILDLDALRRGSVE